MDGFHFLHFTANTAGYFFDSEAEQYRKGTGSHLRSGPRDTLTAKFHRIAASRCWDGTYRTYANYLEAKSMTLGGYSPISKELITSYLSYLCRRMESPKDNLLRRCFISLAWNSAIGLLFAEPSFSLIREIKDDGTIIERKEITPPRDHVAHVGLVFFFGKWLLSHESVFKQVLDWYTHSSSEPQRLALSVYSDFKLNRDSLLQIWDLASLAHDCAYMLQLEAALVRLRGGHCFARDIHPCYARKEGLKKWFKSVWDRLKSRWNPTNTAAFDTVRNSLAQEIDNWDGDRPDHSQIAGILILEYLLEEIKPAPEDEDKAIALLATLAIFRHTAWSQKISCRANWEKDCISSFLATVDEASEWSRVFWQRFDTRRPVGCWTRIDLRAATLVDGMLINLSSNGIKEIRYYYSRDDYGAVAIDKALGGTKRGKLQSAFGHLLSSPGFTVELIPVADTHKRPLVLIQGKAVSFLGI